MFLGFAPANILAAQLAISAVIVSIEATYPPVLGVPSSQNPIVVNVIIGQLLIDIII